tara:strand:- start:493 stop:1146 length:654 start_codon:yes stop_codon:yes gene_type:complete
MSGFIGLSQKRNGLINQFTSLGIDDNATSNAVTIDASENVTITDGAHDFDVASHDTSNGLKLGGTLVSATATELNILDGKSATDLVPSNLVAYRASGESTPSGWSEYTSCRGRMIVGLPSSGTDGGTVGTAYTNTQNKSAALAAHYHKLGLRLGTTLTWDNTPLYGTDGTFTRTTIGGDTVNALSGQATAKTSTTSGGTVTTTDLLAYIQLMTIKKD